MKPLDLIKIAKYALRHREATMTFLAQFFGKEPNDSRTLAYKIVVRELSREMTRMKKTIDDQRVEIANLRARLLLGDRDV